jgi:hypothetical protein
LKKGLCVTTVDLTEVQHDECLIRLYIDLYISHDEAVLSEPQ